jgi:single-strand DNA-binding protein
VDVRGVVRRGLVVERSARPKRAVRSDSCFPAAPPKLGSAERGARNVRCRRDTFQNRTASNENRTNVANFNKVMLMGNLTRDPELRHTQAGMALAKFGMAINRKWSQNGEQKEETCFVDLTAWGKQAELLNQYVKKGSPLFVEGRLQYSTWESQDGGKRNKLEVVVENFQFVSTGRGAGGGGGGGGMSEEGGGGGGERRPASRRPAAAEGGGGSAGGGGGDVDYGDIPF